MIGFAIFVPGQGVPAPQGGTREGKLLWNVQTVQPAKFGGQTKCLAMGVGRPHGVLPCAGGQIGWWFASFRALVAKGGPFCVCKCGVPAGLVSKNAQTPPKVNQNGPTGHRECQTGPLFWPKEGPRALLFVPGPPWGQQCPNLQFAGPPSRATPSRCWVATKGRHVPGVLWGGGVCA